MSRPIRQEELKVTLARLDQRYEDLNERLTKLEEVVSILARLEMLVREQHRRVT